ncbi:MAG: DUF4625 domain-containing protein [Prevotellaceae bacterium]|nr:DUF4625 domain-containing protein [Prevotellaceae bacterium]
MKTLKTLKTLCFYAAFPLAGWALFATACSNDDKDTTGPVITVDEPVNGDTAHAGEAHGLHIEFDLKDESELNTYKIDIHSGAGHSHSTSLLKAVANDWSYQKMVKMDTVEQGLKNHRVHVHSDSIPANATLGEYHLGILATDVHGNESSQYITFYLAEPDDDHDDHDDHDDDDHENE